MLLYLLLQSVLSFGEIATGQNQYNSYNPDTYDVCQVQYTMQHYQQGQCVEIDRPIKNGSTETFKLRSVVLREKSEVSEKYPTLVVIPGGPGESSGPFRYALNDKDILNAMLVHLKLKVVLYDPRGTGTSKLKMAPQNYDLTVFNQENMVEDVKALIDTVSPSAPVLILGHSAGGAVALRLAQKYPQMISKIALVSAAVSPRHMSTMNMKFYGKNPVLWNEYLESSPLSKTDLEDLTKKYLFVEDVSIQQLKARALKQYVHKDVRRLPFEIRSMLLYAINSDSTGAKVKDFIDTVYTDFLSVEKTSGQALVPKELRNLKISGDHGSMSTKFVDNEWIKVAIMCGQGLYTQELQQDIVFDGLTMSWYCNAFSTQTPVDIDLSDIQTPVAFFAGAHDSQVPPNEAAKITRALPHASLIISDKAGHNMFSEDATTFYFGMEKFLQ